MKFFIRYLISFIFFAFIILFSLSINNSPSINNIDIVQKLNSIKEIDKESIITLHKEIIDFEGFDNEIGLNETIIPNIVHLIYFQHTVLRFYQLVNIFSIYFNHRPDFIYIHCDNCTFEGKYFNILKGYKEIWSLIKFYQVEPKETIFGVSYA